MENQTQETKFEQWCIVEIMGHQRLAGLVTEVTMFGAPMLRIDVPDTPAQKGFTKFYGAGAIYAVTPTTEEVATAVAGYRDHRPVERYELAALNPPTTNSLDIAGFDYDPDCAACLRHIPHSISEHEDHLRRSAESGQDEDEVIDGYDESDPYPGDDDSDVDFGNPDTSSGDEDDFDDTDDFPVDEPTDEQVSDAIDARRTRELGFDPPGYDDMEES